ncbi:unnamed protein product [Cylicocyclus nassatus]|uniref:Uncharacterized protein n=1 Tax=Cylicocyclus nassatus TaxID=53992 RepID=A0AA36MCY5_CYLNA|nr:unnamed protein product [Cylicocyclus nassatus]
MQAALLVVLIGVWIVSAIYDGPVFVDVLRFLVKHKSDRNFLRALGDNGHLNRTTKEAVVNEILELQDEKTQEAYATKVQKKKQLRKARYDEAIEGLKAVENYLKQAEKINNDTAITDDDARTKMKELKRKLNLKQRRLAVQVEKLNYGEE